MPKSFPALTLEQKKEIIKRIREKEEGVAYLTNRQIILDTANYNAAEGVTIEESSI